MRIRMPSNPAAVCGSCGRRLPRHLEVSVLDLFGVAFLTLTLGGMAWFLVAEDFLTRISGKSWGGGIVLGLLFLIGFAWKYFLRLEVRTAACPRCRPAPGP